MARKGKYSKETTKEICKYLMDGLTARDACKIIGITEETYYQWKKTKPDFTEAVDKAGLILKRQQIKKVLEAGDKDWRSSAWWLERKYTDEYYIRKNEPPQQPVNVLVYLPERKVIEGEIQTPVLTEANGNSKMDTVP